MPIYEYSCNKCGKNFEVLQSMGEGAEGLTCPSCGESELSKQFSTFAAGSAETTASAVGQGGGAPACGTGFT
jgi:putative FmdB family regulatory protein